MEANKNKQNESTQFQNLEEFSLIVLPHEIESVPKSEILKVSVRKGKQFIGECAIVTDCNEQDTANGIYWSERTLAKAIQCQQLKVKY